MNVLILHGSARIGGDTDTMAAKFMEGLGGETAHEVSHFRPIEMEIAHCRGATCLQCSHGAGCVVQDDMQDVYAALEAADIVVMATPMFWGYMTSQLKTLFDRFEACCHPRFFGGKDFVLLIGYRHYYGSMIEWLERITKGFGSRCHALAVQTYDPETDQDLPIATMPDRLEEAVQLGRSLASR